MGLMQRFQAAIKASKLYLGSGGMVDALSGVSFARVWTNAGAPTSGGSGTLNGTANPGDLLVDTTNLKTYQNTNTKASPTWTVFESSGGSVVLSSADALTAHSGGGKSSALALTANINRVSTVAAVHDSVLAPPAGPGGLAVFINDGANAMDIYGAGSDTLNDVVTTSPTTLEAGGTLVMWSSVAGKWYFQNLVGATAQSQPGAPTAPSSTSAFQMQGLAGAITPKKSGTVLLMISGNIISSATTAGDGIEYQLSYGTGTAPTVNTALAGTQVGATQEATINNTAGAPGDVNVPFSIQAVITGLTLGTAYWLDLAAKAVTAANVIGLSNVSVTAVEL